MAHTIHIADRDIAFHADDARSILDNALAAGYEVPYSCRSGVCGSCRGRITGGEVLGGSGAGVLGDDERQQGHVLLCQARACSDVTVAVRDIHRRDPDATRSVRAKVHKLTRAAPDVTVVHLRFPAGIKVRFKAGQYLHARLEDGTVRHYSMANPPTQNDGVELHVRHVPGGRFTAHLAGEMQVGHFLDVTLPFGDFTVREPGGDAGAESEALPTPIVLIASGTGFAPIRAMVEHMKAKGIDRPVTVYWGGRRPHDLYSDDVAKGWAQEMPNLTYVPVVSNALPEDNWTGRTGFVHRAVLEDFKDLSGYQVYACGAPIVVESAGRDFQAEAGLPFDEFYADSFTSEADIAANTV